MSDLAGHGFGIYIHWPFCQSLCPYCDFNSYVAGDIDQTEWADAYVQDLRHHASLTEGRVVNSVFFGGGTPSLMENATLDLILSEIRKLWPISNEIEITLEANPSSVEASRFEGYAQSGVNRVSMGFQALNNKDLKRLGRLHSTEEALRAFNIANQFFDRVSFDLIYARQDQTLSDWEDELSQAISMGPDHLSLYQLTIEEGTTFGDLYAKGRLHGLPNENRASDMYDLTQEICNKANLPQYEISNHAKPGNESLHNLIYWRGGDYIGIGPGAHGRLTIGADRYATETPLAPKAWIERVHSKGSGCKEPTKLSKRDRGIEYLLMGLRIIEGINIQYFQYVSGKSLSEKRISELSKDGLVYFDGDHLKATQSGRLLLNGIIRELIEDDDNA